MGFSPFGERYNLDTPEGRAAYLKANPPAKPETQKEKTDRINNWWNSRGQGQRGGASKMMSGGNVGIPESNKNKSKNKNPKLSNSVTNFLGVSYNMDDPAQVKKYRAAQAAHIEQVKKDTGNKMADHRGGGGYNPNKPENRNPYPTETITRKEDGTQTSPNTGNVPMNWQEYEAFLNKKGIQLQSAREQRNGFQSNDLPNQEAPITSETMKGQSGAYNDMLYGGKLSQGELTIPTQLQGVGTGYADAYRSLTYGADPQSGASSIPDQMDQSRAIEGEGKPKAEKRRRPSGARQGDMFDRDNRFEMGAIDETPASSGISARSRAFLDAPMGKGPLDTMRRTNASQNIMRVGGKIGVKGADGNVTEISQEGYDAIRSGKRDQAEFSQDFLKQYITQPATPKESQSSDSQAPVAASQDPIQEAAPSGTEIPVSDISENVTMFEDGREPLMRFKGGKNMFQ